MSIDGKALRQVMGHFATGVTVVTTRGADGEPIGLTVNSFTSVSLDPPQALVCIDKRAASHDAFLHAGVFVVNFLGLDQEEVSTRFATPVEDRFAGLPTRTSPLGAAIIEGSMGHLECRVVAAYPGGDHTIYLGEIEHAEADGDSPLLYFRGRYARLAD